MANFVMGLISMTVGVVVLATVFIYNVKNTSQVYSCQVWNGSAYVSSTCSWTASEIALWGLLTICGIAGMVYGLLSVFGIV